MRKVILCGILFFSALFFIACSPPSTENTFRKEGKYPSNFKVPVAFLVNEWAGKPKILASGWLIDGGNGTFFSAKHHTDTFMNDTVELGAHECKIFLNGQVYDCLVVQVPPLRDAVVLKISGSFDQAGFPQPYKISETKLKIGETVYVQGFHPHPSEVTKSNLNDGLRDLIVPIFKTFYGLREADPERQKEVVFDSLEAVVTGINEHIKIGAEHEQDVESGLKFGVNEYVKVVTKINHKFSFGGLSGGVVVRLNTQGIPEAVGILTAEDSVRLEYDKKGKLMNKKVKIYVSDTMFITPIYTVKDLYEYARTAK